MSQKSFFAVALITVGFAGATYAATPADKTRTVAEAAAAAQAPSALTREEVIAELQRARASGEMQQWDTNSYARPTLNRLYEARAQNAKPSRM